MRALIAALVLTTSMVIQLIVPAALADEPRVGVAVKPDPALLTTSSAHCPVGSRIDTVCGEQAPRDAKGTPDYSKCPCVPTAKAAPLESEKPSGRMVKSGTIKLVCPAGTEKYCDGNKCSCWTIKD